MIISITPTNSCNLNCDYCFLRGEHKSPTLDLTILQRRLYEVRHFSPIDYITLAGGEITTLPASYIAELFDLLKDYNITVISNLYDYSKISKYKFNLITSINIERADFNSIRSKIKNLDRPVTVNNVVFKNTIPNQELLNQLDLPNVERVCFIKYIPTKKSKGLTLSDYEFEQFLLALKPLKYSYIIDNFESPLKEDTVPMILINPWGKYEISEDINGYEESFVFDSFLDYIRYINKCNKDCMVCPKLKECCCHTNNDVYSAEYIRKVSE